MKKRIALLVIGILIVIISIVDVAFAFLSNEAYIGEGAKSNVAIDTCTKLQFSDKENNSINLTNTYPMADEMGLETIPYEFTISSTCEEYGGFNLYLVSFNDNTLEDNNIKFALANENNDILVSNILSDEIKEQNDFNEEEKVQIDTLTKKEQKTIYKIYSSNISIGKEYHYKLYLWINKDATNATIDKSFSSSLIVKSYEREETLAEYLIKNQDKTLIYHDGNCDFEEEENCELEAGDLSYRYSGSSEEVKNYVCLGETTTEGSCESDDDLYRIIGLFKNSSNQYEIKVIKSSPATSNQLGTNGAYKADSENKYYWNKNQNESGTDTNKWSESNLNKKNLNGYFWNSYLEEHNKELKNKIANHTWIVGGNTENNIIKTANMKTVYDYEVGANKLTTEDYCVGSSTQCTKEYLTYPYEGMDTSNQNTKIGLMYASDYGYAASPTYWTTQLYSYNSSTVKTNNWMYMNNSTTEWTISRVSGSYYAFTVISAGSVGRNGSVDSYAYAARPVFYLASSVTIASGNGSTTAPYRVSD